MRPAAWDAPARLVDMDTDGIDQSVLYPTLLLGIQGHPDVEFAAVMCRAYNDWLSEHTRPGGGRLFGVAVLPQQDIELAAARDPSGGGSARDRGGVPASQPQLRTGARSPTPVYDPLWRAASETGMPVGLHPFLAADLPGACLGLRINRLRKSANPLPDDTGTVAIDNIFFTQAIANPFDMMSSMTFLLAGGVCERFPDLRLVFLEAGGGWLVPWLERLDHHYEIFGWDVPQLTTRALGVLPPPVLDQLRPRRVHPRLHGPVTAVRGRSHRVGIGLPPSRRRVPGCDPRAVRSHRRAVGAATSA